MLSLVESLAGRLGEDEKRPEHEGQNGKKERQISESSPKIFDPWSDPVVPDRAGSRRSGAHLEERVPVGPAAGGRLAADVDLVNGRVNSPTTSERHPAG
jgi:hypothetical protein